MQSDFTFITFCNTESNELSNSKTVSLDIARQICQAKHNGHIRKGFHCSNLFQ